VKLLLDECVDHRLASDIAGHETSSVGRMGWSGTKNGALLTLAAAEFDAFITTDRNLSFQQNMSRFEIGLVVLEARSNRLTELRRLVPELLEALPFLRPGEIRRIGT
jgi:hypothetical protein